MVVANKNKMKQGFASKNCYSCALRRIYPIILFQFSIFVLCNLLNCTNSSISNVKTNIIGTWSSVVVAPHDTLFHLLEITFGDSLFRLRQKDCSCKSSSFDSCRCPKTNLSADGNYFIERKKEFSKTNLHLILRGGYSQESSSPDDTTKRQIELNSKQDSVRYFLNNITQLRFYELNFLRNYSFLVNDSLLILNVPVGLTKIDSLIQPITMKRRRQLSTSLIYP